MHFFLKKTATDTREKGPPKSSIWKE